MCCNRSTSYGQRFASKKNSFKHYSWSTVVFVFEELEKDSEFMKMTRGEKSQALAKVIQYQANILSDWANPKSRMHKTMLNKLDQ